MRERKVSGTSSRPEPAVRAALLRMLFGFRPERGQALAAGVVKASSVALASLRIFFHPGLWILVASSGSSPLLAWRASATSSLCKAAI